MSRVRRCRRSVTPPLLLQVTRPVAAAWRAQPPNDGALGGSDIELARAGEPGLRIGHQLVPLGNPTDLTPRRHSRR